MYQWRKLQFFDKVLAHNAKALATSPLGVHCFVNPLTLQNVNVTCATSNMAHLVVGDLKGVVRVLNSDFSLVAKFTAYTDSVKFVAHNMEHNCLSAFCQPLLVKLAPKQIQNNLFLLDRLAHTVKVTVGHDEEATSATVRFWDLSQRDHEGNPVCFLDILLNSQLPASALAVSADMHTTMIGLCDGNVFLLSGNARKGKLRQHELVVQNGNPITNLVYSVTAEGGEVVWITTSDIVVSYRLSNGNLFKEKELERIGSEANRACLSGDKKLVIARKEGIYLYNVQAKAQGIPWEAKKKICTWFGRYLIVVEGSDANSRHKLSVFDIKDQYIAFQNNFTDVTHVIQAWDKIVIISKDGSYFCLTEKELQERLDTLNKRHMYAIAINIASDAKWPIERIADIYRSYGDHLYNKGDYDAAMKVYIQTIGIKSIESSSIIKKFLENQHNGNLTFYLESLHEQSHATAHHTTLLFNCYIKSKDFDKISNFIKRPELSFDYKAVIRVCREAGFFDFALELAKRKKITKWYLKLLIEDFKRYDEALEHIRTLEFEQAKTAIQRVGKLLLAVLPEETTKFLMELCTNYTPLRAQENEVEDDAGPKMKLKANPEEFMRIFATYPKLQLRFLDYIVANQGGSEKVYNARLNCLLRETGAKQGDAKQKALEFLSAPELTCDVNHALILSQMHAFDEGTIKIYERLERGNEIAQYYMEKRSYNKLIETCKKYGKNNPKLWQQALIYFADQPVSTAPHLKEVLTNLEGSRAGDPIKIIDVLANSNHELGVIQAMLGRHLQHQQKKIEEDFKEIRNHIEEIDQIQDRIKKLQTEAIVFDRHCGNDYELPTVHFLSGDSFSLYDLPNKDFNPNTSKEYSNLSHRAKMLRISSQNHNEFFRQLDASDDGFSVISTYLGRGLFQKSEGGKEEIAELDPNIFADLGLKMI